MMQYVWLPKKGLHLLQIEMVLSLYCQKYHYENLQHKIHITKVMSLSAFAYPYIILSTREVWDGKLGICAFVKQCSTTYNSKNCSKEIMNRQ